MSNIECVFCGKNKPRAKEHIWPRWLQKKICGDTKWRFLGMHTSPIFLISKREHSGENLVLGNVCADCNSGWMSQLEVKFASVLDKAISANNPSLLSKEERETIALWSFKTALVINAGSNYRRIFPDDHYKHLYKYKSIAKDVKIDLGYIKNKVSLEWQQSCISFAVGKKTKDILQNNPRMLYTDSAVITMQIGNIGLRVSHFEDSKKRGYDVEYNNPESVYRIWPFKRNSKFDKKRPFSDINNMQLAVSLIER